MTSMSLHGAYEHQQEGFPQVKYGHPKDRRADLMQVQAGIAISADGGVPVFHRAYDGGAGEVSQVVGAMTALRELAASREFLMIGDSKLISYGNLLALQEAGVRFIAPAPAAKIPTACMPGSIPVRHVRSTTPPDGWLYRRLTTAVVHDCGRYLPRRDVDVDENGRQHATAVRVTASMLRHRSPGPVASAFCPRPPKLRCRRRRRNAAPGGLCCPSS
ncbi:hypothetical protein AB0D12_39925 [Streptomyces sp. NPDC048479]|uniref:hypothetical protein n=1 Tax=Streptomyces sp. NPDC048479 TaxID=3154725 RepID=UPI0034275248